MISRIEPEFKINWTKKEKIDPRNKQDLQVLELRAASLWLELVEGDLKSKHKVLYHRCCGCFSKAKAGKTACHPEEQTISLADLISEREMKDSGDLAEYLVEELEQKPSYLQLVPRLNYVHQSDLNLEEVTEEFQKENMCLVQRIQDSQEEIMLLRQKVAELEQERIQHLEIIKKLQEPDTKKQDARMVPNLPSHQRRNSRSRNKRKPTSLEVISLVTPLKK